MVQTHPVKTGTDSMEIFLQELRPHVHVCVCQWSTCVKLMKVFSVFYAFVARSTNAWQQILTLPINFSFSLLSKIQHFLSPVSTPAVHTQTSRMTRPQRVFLENCCESVPGPFSHLMNEISHAALLQALAHLGGKAPLYLSLMPSNTLLPFINYYTHFGNKHPINWNI